MLLHSVGGGGENQANLFLHFDVASHDLRLETFVTAAQSLQAIANDINSTFYSGKLSFSISVAPPQSGTFLASFKLAALAVAGLVGVVHYLETEIGKAYFRGFTGYEPSVYAERLGKAHFELMQKIAKRSSGGEEEQSSGGGEAWLEPEDEALLCELSESFMAETIKGILSLSEQDLAELGLPPGLLFEALTARSEFYLSCYDDRDIDGIGFGPEDDFPIRRGSFPERAQRPTRVPDEDEGGPWTVEIADIIVTSPNWDRLDQTSRQWKAKDSSQRDCFFVVEDDYFWQCVDGKKLEANTPDRLKVQWIIRKRDAQKKVQRRVISVLEFNGSELSAPLSIDAVRERMGDAEISGDETPRDLFSFL